MARFKQPIFARTLLPLWVLTASSASVASPMNLKESIVTRKDEICLGDFLPPEATERIRALAAYVSLGKSPMPGQHRTIEREQLVRALISSPDLERSIELPQSLEVTRWSRHLTRQEIAQAVQQALRENHLGDGVNISEADVSLSTNAIVSEDSPTLRILRFEPSPDHTGTRVQIWTASEPEVPPFWAQVSRPFDEFKPIANRKPAASAPPASRLSSIDPSADSPVLVKAGVQVEVVMQGRGMRIATSGVALSPGRQGQPIRVRTLPAGRILSGTLVTPKTVEIDF